MSAREKDTNPQGNFTPPAASKPMSSISGAHYEPDLPAVERADSASAGTADLQQSQQQQQTDLELLRKAQTGDRAAFGQLVLHVQDRLYNALLRLVGDPEEARELTQEAFTRALVKIESFRGDAAPYTWLFRIAVNLAISQLRKVQRRRTFSLDQATSGNGATAHSAAEDQASNLIDRVAQAREESDPAQVVENRERDQKVLAALGRL